MTRLLFAALFLLALVSFVEAQDAKPNPKKDKKDELKLSEEEQGIIEHTNAARKKADLPPLKANAQLMEAARAHAANMAKQHKMAHELDGKQVADRVTDAGYDYGSVGENVSRDQRTPKEVLGVWMHSKGHRENILDKDYTEIGVATIKSSRGQVYWVQVFGTPSGK